MSTTYEKQLELVGGLIRASSEDDRHIEWCSDAGPLGLARNPRDRIEIFVEGPELTPRLKRVREAVEYQRWFRSDGTEFLANRILLPSAGHFEQVAAFLCTEMLRNGAQNDVVAAFAKTEALIDLAIGDLLIADEALLGLVGEVVFLNALLQVSNDQRVPDLLGSWKGYRETARDFQVGPIGVEVKTTTASASSHRFSGIPQLEPGHGVDGVDEDSFFVLSIGLEWVNPDDNQNSVSLPQLVDDLIERITTATGSSSQLFVDEFIAQLAAYGPASAVGYDHRTMSESARFRRRFRLTFARCYDMTDKAIRLLSTDDMRARPFIDVSSVKVRVNLPDQVSGDVNPTTGLGACARMIVEASADL